jgi:hypothetical protein
MLFNWQIWRLNNKGKALRDDMIFKGTGRWYQILQRLVEIYKVYLQLGIYNHIILVSYEGTRQHGSIFCMGMSYYC